MERKKCRRCAHPMTRLLTNDAGKWSACYTCLSCGCETATVTAKSEMAAEDILRAALSGYPCNSCENNTLDVLCDCDCADCEHHCTCHECHDHESFVWRGGK